MLAFCADYGTIEEATRTRILMEQYLNCASKGTKENNTSDALIRLFVRHKTELPHISIDDTDSRIYFKISVDTQAQRGSFNAAFGLLEDILHDPLALHDGAVVERARDEQLKNIAMRVQRHQSQAYELFNQSLFPSLYPISEKKEIELITDSGIRKLKATFDNHLARSFPVVLYSGRLEKAEARTEILKGTAKKLVGQGSKNILVPPAYVNMPKTDEPIIKHANTNQVHHFRAYPLSKKLTDSKDRVSMFCLNQILGGGWTGRLMRVIREEDHLVYGIGSGLIPFKNMLLVRTEHDQSLLDKVYDRTTEVVTDICQGNFTDEEFYQTKDMMLESNLYTNAGRNIETCDQPGFRVFREYKKEVIMISPLGLLDAYRLLDSLGPEDVRDTARRYLDPDNSQLFLYANTTKGDVQ